MVGIREPEKSALTFVFVQSKIADYLQWSEQLEPKLCSTHFQKGTVTVQLGTSVARLRIVVEKHVMHSVDVFYRDLRETDTSL